ncbi:MAG TPA: hypothetical protein VGH11_12405 [Jatrophihabitans sp.]|jgi:hypothetical protein
MTNDLGVWTADDCALACCVDVLCQMQKGTNAMPRERHSSSTSNER